MPSGNFANTMVEFPQQRALLARLQSLFDQQAEYTFQALVSLVRPPTPELLALLLDELARRGVVVRIFRLESPFSHGGLRDFPSVFDVPNTYYDEDFEREFEVRPENVLPIFRRA